MCLLAVLSSQGIVVKCIAAIFFRSLNCNRLNRIGNMATYVEIAQGSLYQLRTPDLRVIYKLLMRLNCKRMFSNELINVTNAKL